MSDQKYIFALLAAAPPPGVKLDPADPRTWWMSTAEQEPNRFPVAAQMHDHCMRLAGVSARKFYYDPMVNVKVGAAVAAYYGIDSPLAIPDVYNYEAEAMGQKMIYGEDSMPTIDFREPLVSEPKDLSKLKAPEWLEKPRIRYILDLTKFNLEMGVISGMFCAPFSLAVGVRSYPKLIRDMKRDKPFAHDLFTKLVDDVLPSYLKVMKDYTGVTVATGADAWAAFPNLSPDLMEEWVVPYSLKLTQNCAKFGFTASAVASGDYCEERIERFDKQILFKCFDVQVALLGGAPVILLGMGRWQDYPIEAVAEYLRPYKEKGVKATVSAAINARLLRDGPVEKIVDNVKRFVDLLGRDHTVLIFLASIPADTPPEHVHAAVAAAHAYSQLPIADDLDKIEVKIPKRESFKEFVQKTSQGAGLGV